MTLRLGDTSRRLDPEAVSQGVRKECPHRPGLWVTLLPAAHFNPRWRKALARMARAEHRAQKDTDASDGEEAVTVMDRLSDPRLLADAIVTDMEGIYDEKGKAVEYTPELGVEILSDPANCDVADWIATQSFSWGQFYEEEVEQDEKNSGSGSSGKKAGAARSKRTRS